MSESHTKTARAAASKRCSRFAYPSLVLLAFVAMVWALLLSHEGSVEATGEQSCSADAECQAGELCLRSACRSVECRSSEQCAKTERCLAYACVLPSCRRNADCSGDALCFDGQCRIPVFEPLGVDGREMALVPGGAFLMGSSVDTAVSDEKPSHWVEIDGFWLDRYEVTAADYARCVDAGACTEMGTLPSSEQSQCSYSKDRQSKKPMNCVSWGAAKNFCSWAGKRLPSEAEWERAAGGGQGFDYPWGNDAPSCKNCCRKDREDGCGNKGPCDIGEKSADLSAVGIQDMAGNVSEWVSDWYDPAYYDVSPRLRPLGPQSAERRSVRGGDFSDLFDPLRIVNRDRLSPELRSATVGFRCARSL